MEESVSVFVSYQRTDTIFAAHALGYALRGAGCKAFVDTGSIPGGEDYRRAIREAVGKANLMLALIGPKFEFKRLHDVYGDVAFEWRRARFHGVALISVCVDEGRFPDAAELPADLRWFSKRNGYSLRQNSFSRDVGALVNAVPVLATMPG